MERLRSSPCNMMRLHRKPYTDGHLDVQWGGFVAALHCSFTTKGCKTALTWRGCKAAFICAGGMRRRARDRERKVDRERELESYTVRVSLQLWFELRACSEGLFCTRNASTCSSHVAIIRAQERQDLFQQTGVRRSAETIGIRRVSSNCL